MISLGATSSWYCWGVNKVRRWLTASGEKPSLECRRTAEHGSSSENRRLVVAMLARHGKSNRAVRFERRSIKATENPEKFSALEDFFSASQFYGMNLIHQMSKATSREAPVQHGAATANPRVSKGSKSVIWYYSLCTVFPSSLAPANDRHWWYISPTSWCVRFINPVSPLIILE